MMNARVYARKPDKRGGMMDARVGDVSVPAESPQQKSQSVTNAPVEGMQNARVYNTVPTATEEKTPAPKTYAVKDSEANASVAAPVQEASQAVQTTPQTTQKKPYTHWWQTPEYLGEVNRRAADAEKRAEQDRKRAVRQRNTAILGDLAKLGAQMYAKEGGATRIDQFTPATEKANDKLAALRERHAAEVAAFAKERAAARQAQIADNNARMKLETSLAEADLDRRIKAAEKAADIEYKEKLLGIRQTEADTAAKNAGTRANNAVKEYRAYDKDGNAHYFKTKGAADSFAQQEGTWVENPVEVVTVREGVDIFGNPETTTTTRTSTKGGSSQKPGEKKKNPMGSGKKANPMN